MAETIDKFEEDVLKQSTASLKGSRTARVRFGEPIAVSGDRKDRGQPARISSQAEASVQAMLDDL